MTRITALACAAALVCAAVLPCGFRLQAEGASASSTQNPAQQDPSFRAATVLVEADAIVTDASGRFVGGLTPNDFEVLENGSPQRIDRLYTVKGPTVISSAPREEAAPEQSVPATGPGRVFVLLFDREHMQAGSFKRLQQAAIGFLTTEFQQGDIGGIVVGDAMAGNHLTSSREELIAAVAHAKPDFSTAARRMDLLDWPRFSNEPEAVRIAISNDREVLDQVVRRACTDDPGACRQGAEMVEQLVQSKARNIVGEMRPSAAKSLRALQALAAGLARVPGRKTIVLMTDGFFIEESWADLRQIVGTAARSNVRIYSIDSRGMDTRPANDIRQLSMMDESGAPPLQAYNTIEDGPNVLAVDTGGFAIRRTNDFSRALDDIARDTSEYYVIGYVPTNSATDGSFRTITVRVKRPGLKIRARRGYLAVPNAPESRTRQPGPVEPGTPAAEHGNGGPGETAEPVLSVGVPDALLFGEGVAIASMGGTSARRPLEPPGFALRPDSSDRIDELAARDGNRGAQDSLASRGWDRYRSGDLEGAAALLEKAAAEPDAHAWVHYVLGYSELGLRRIDRAAQEWEHVRAQVPEFRPVYLDLGDAYMQLQNYARAIDVLKAAAIRWPGDVDVMNAIGTIQVRRGTLSDAIRTFESAIRANPDDALAYFNLARTHELRYFKLRRYSPFDGRPIGNRTDISAAIANYEQYVKLGGPYVDQASQALHNLAWLR
jgi:VWFA-related protein